LSETEVQRNVRLADQWKRSATNRLSKSEQRKTARLTYRQQHSKATESIRGKQHMVEQNQIVNIQRQQRVLEKKQQTLLDQYKWPAAISTQLKEYCLQDFSDHTSMSVLRQSVCIICNIRASASTMKEFALQTIPKSEKLSCHADLMDIITKTLKITQSGNSNCVITFVNV
jgi:hypothetical protein